MCVEWGGGGGGGESGAEEWLPFGGVIDNEGAFGSLLGVMAFYI